MIRICKHDIFYIKILPMRPDNFYCAYLPRFELCFMSLGSDFFFFQITAATTAEINTMAPIDALVPINLDLESDAVIYIYIVVYKGRWDSSKKFYKPYS